MPAAYYGHAETVSIALRQGAGPQFHSMIEDKAQSQVRFSRAFADVVKVLAEQGKSRHTGWTGKCSRLCRDVQERGTVEVAGGVVFLVDQAYGSFWCMHVLSNLTFCNSKKRSQDL